MLGVLWLFHVINRGVRTLSNIYNRALWEDENLPTIFAKCFIIYVWQRPLICFWAIWDFDWFFERSNLKMVLSALVISKICKLRKYLSCSIYCELIKECFAYLFHLDHVQPGFNFKQKANLTFQQRIG